MAAGSRPLWSYAFRPFFLLAGAFAILAMAQWLLVLRGLPWPRTGSFSTVWHAHEMTVGFAGAVVAGFLLTAVATWTQRPPIRGAALGWLVAAWLAGRVVLWAGTLSPALTAAADMAFPVLLAGFLSREVGAARNRRNYPLAALAWLFATLNGVYHAATIAGTAGILAADTSLLTARLAVNLLLQLLVLMVTVVGGRVIPSFTANWLRMRQVSRLPVSRPWLERLVIASTLLAGLAVSIDPVHRVSGVLCLLAGTAHAVRVAGWRGLATLDEPLLFVMHAAYLTLPAGFLLLGAVPFGLPLPGTAALHALAVGTVGGMILAMMTRVALGHTGRPLTTAAITRVAYVLLGLSVLLRVLGPGFAPVASYQISGLLWILSFLLFLWHYVPVLVGPRVNG